MTQTLKSVVTWNPVYHWRIFSYVSPVWLHKTSSQILKYRRKEGEEQACVLSHYPIFTGIKIPTTALIWSLSFSQITFFSSLLGTRGRETECVCNWLTQKQDNLAFSNHCEDFQKLSWRFKHQSEAYFLVTSPISLETYPLMIKKQFCRISFGSADLSRYNFSFHIETAISEKVETNLL